MKKLPVLLCSVAVSISSAVAAQDYSSVMEEVVVTATKRAENIQDVPMSIAAVSGENLEKMSVDTFEDLSSQIPSFMVGEGIATTNIVMRGMGSGNNRGFEQSVAMFIDGVYMPRSRQYITPFFDVERVEVLRGPQAVMFGLNSTAGSVSLITAKTNPGDEFFTEVSGEYDFDYEGTKLTAVAGGSLGEKIGVRLSVQHADGDEGFYTNAFNGSSEGGIEQDFVRATVVFEPSDSLTISLKGEYAEFEQNGSIGEIFGPNGASWDGDGDLNWRRNTDGQDLNLFHSDGAGQYLENKNLTLTVDYEFTNSVLTAVVGYSDFKYDLVTDLDTTSSNIGFGLDAAIDESYDQNSIELRLSSTGDSAFQYIVGAYSQDSSNDQLQPNIFFLGELVPGFGPLRVLAGNDVDYDSDMKSVFASGTYNISDTVRLTAGFRYTDEEKSSTTTGLCDYVPSDASYALVFGDPANVGLCGQSTAALRGSRDSDNFMPEIAVQWDSSDNTMLYAKVASSAKAGGFSTGGTEFDDEKVIGFEAGLKSTLLDGRADVDVTVFYNDFEDLQVNSFDNSLPPVSLLTNAGESRTQGVEVNGRFAVSPSVVVGGSLGYLDAEYTSFDRGPCPVGVTAPCNLSGRTMPWAPEFSGNVFLDVIHPISNKINFVGDLNVSYSGSYFVDGSRDPVTHSDSWTKVSARIGIEASDGRWSVAVVGRNLTDEVVLNTAQPLAGRYLGFISAPRTVLLQAKVRLGSY
jgi:outer membrane receptor protein involved in Fe transport